MSAQKIHVEVRGRVAVLTLANPPMNVVTLDLTRAMNAELTRLAADPNVGALVLRGSGGRAFCAGSDIKEFPGLVAEGAIVSKKLEYENETYGAVANFPKPTVAAIEGLALGGGLELAAGCDLIVLSETSRVGLPEILLGAFPGSGGTVRVTQRIGVGRAKEMMLLGDMIDAQTALDWGLANRIAKEGEVVETAIALAARMAEGPAQATFACKRAIAYAWDLPEAEAIRRTLDLSEGLSKTGDLKEGVKAFFEKRKPNFTDQYDPEVFGLSK